MRAHHKLITILLLSLASSLTAPMITAPLLAQEEGIALPGPVGPPVAPAKPLEKFPFWKNKLVKIPALKKIDVKLLETPNEEIDFAVIQVGGQNSVNFLDGNTTSRISSFLEKAEIPYALADEPLKVGSKVFRDRKYVVTELPDALKGLSHLQTRAAHKAIVDARYAILLETEIETEKPIWVFLAIDQRAIGNYTALGTPGWLKEYSPTEYRIVTDDPIMAASQSGFQIYAKKVLPGKFTLGAPGLEVRYHSMYFAFFGEEK